MSKISRTSQIGGALLGGMIAGGVGAIIGGLSGSSTTTHMLQKKNLKVIVKDTKQPV